MSKPISVQLYSVRDEAGKDFFGVLKKIASFGYVGVETAGLHGKTPAEVRKALDDLGLVCSSGHVGNANKDNLNEIVDTAKTLGMTIVIGGYGPDEFKTADAIKKSAAQFQASAELLAPHGLKQGYHNHWWEFETIDGQYALELFLKLAPGVVSQLDTYWASNFGVVDVPKLLARIAPRVPLLHIKDGPLVKDQPHVAVGSGKMNFPAVIAAADPKVLQWLVVELDSCGTDMMTAVKASAEYLIKSGLGKGRK
ncbi:MAG: sugar phosphate isomerase/epimerase [Planctomycetota bacterium]|nr:sugar phosphate isomerase/epimerase [Planctomycetota bacterium]